MYCICSALKINPHSMFSKYFSYYFSGVISSPQASKEAAGPLYLPRSPIPVVYSTLRKKNISSRYAARSKTFR